jgi:hypothetical protein
MNSLESKFDNIPKEILKRHYGIESFSNLSNIQLKELKIGDIPGKLIFISAENKLGNEQIKIFMWEDNDSLSLGFPFSDNYGLLLRILRSLSKSNLGKLELSAEKNVNWNFIDFSPISIDVTNLHYLVKTPSQEFRFKWYTRPEKGFNEFKFHRNISDLNIAPQPMLMLAYKNNAIFGLYKEIGSISNLDTVIGDLYDEMLEEKIQITEFYSRMNFYLKQIAGLILKILNLKEKPIFQDLFEKYDKNEWKHILYSNWEGVLKSQIYSQSEQNKISDEYLPILMDYLDHTISNVIHGDVWLRQFGIDQASKNYYLFDLEEMSLGPRMFDIASLLSSISQQFEYFRLKKPEHKVFIDNSSEKLIDMLLTNFPFLEKDYLTEIKHAQCIRIIHELNYLLNYQPNERWLIEFLKDSLRKLLSE